jgi:hypothetical protein
MPTPRGRLSQVTVHSADVVHGRSRPQTGSAWRGGGDCGIVRTNFPHAGIAGGHETRETRRGVETRAPLLFPALSCALLRSPPRANCCEDCLSGDGSAAPGRSFSASGSTHRHMIAGRGLAGAGLGQAWLQAGAANMSAVKPRHCRGENGPGRTDWRVLGGGLCSFCFWGLALCLCLSLPANETEKPVASLCKRSICRPRRR